MEAIVVFTLTLTSQNNLAEAAMPPSNTLNGVLAKLK